MTIPQGVSGYQPFQCCKLKWSLYGLKQANCQWFAKLSNMLKHYGFTHTITVLIIYVDDIILTGNSIAEIGKVKHLLSSNFHIRDLGKLKYFLAIEVVHSSSSISLCQKKYCLDLISDAGLLNSKPCSTTMDTSLRLHHDFSEALTDPLSYKRLVGRLIYLTNTHLDIVFATQQLSQFMISPTQTHF